MTSGRPLSLLRLSFVIAGLMLVGLMVTAAPARADLRVCNDSSNPVSIALGYRAERGWQSEGWWVANPSQCAIVFQGDLNSRFYYLYIADDLGGGAWDGDNFMCTRDETFTIFDTDNCLARGYERTGFFEVDTQNRSDWTLQLKDPVNNDTTGPDTGDDAPLEGEENQPLDGGGGDDVPVD
jgi:uncharacterized membrane protein